MRSPSLYLLFVILPLPGVALLFYQGLSRNALTLLAAYAFVYRPYLDSLRLYRLGVIDEKRHNRWYIPFGPAWWYSITHFSTLFFASVEGE